ncbi:hypothetical protein LEN26_001850 [Aphanomyces euteiches]|nr:hypothetical protein LEN26_001850 [Aphanomyces euteiches]
MVQIASFALLAAAASLLDLTSAVAPLPTGTWPTSQGNVKYSSPYVVKKGEVFDGKMKTYERSNVACTGQTEGGKDTAVFWVENGGTLKNVIIGKNQAKGVHCGDRGCTIENVWWDDVCEDALSIKGGSASSVSKIIGGGARSADDKIIQHNGAGTVAIEGSTPKTLASSTVRAVAARLKSNARSLEDLESGQAEGGKELAVFLVEPGATLKNVIIGKSQAEGVHCESHDCTIQNVWWDDVCEDALTIKGGSASGVAKTTGSGARNAEDKIIQHNYFGMLYRSCGPCKTQYQHKVTLTNVYAVNPKMTLVGVNKNYNDQAESLSYDWRVRRTQLRRRNVDFHCCKLDCVVTTPCNSFLLVVKTPSLRMVSARSTAI